MKPGHAETGTRDYRRNGTAGPRQPPPASGPCPRGCGAAGCRGPAGFRRPLPDPGRRHRPFGPESVHRHHCRLASRSDGSKGHSNGMPAAVVRHPERREVPPPAPEPVARTDGDRRNDRQRNAAARSVDDLRRGHRRLNAIVPQDGPACGGTASAPSPGGDPATTRCRSPAPTPARPGSPTPTAPGTTCATGRRAGQRLPSRHRGQRHRMPGDGHQEEMHREAPPRPGQPDPPRGGETEGVPLGHRPSRGRRQPHAGHARRPVPLADRERDPGTLGNQGHRSGTGFGHGKRRLTTVPAMTVMPASYVQRIRNERRRWLWKNLARFPVQNMPVAFRRPSGSFLCRGRRRRVPPGGVGAGLAPQDGLDRYRLGSRQRIRGEAWSARPPVRLPGPGWMPGFSEPDHREARSGRA